MFDQLSLEILASLILGSMPTATTTTKQNVNPAVYCSCVKSMKNRFLGVSQFGRKMALIEEHAATFIFSAMLL
jgi:hypothetical protein